MAVIKVLASRGISFLLIVNDFWYPPLRETLMSPGILDWLAGAKRNGANHGVTSAEKDVLERVSSVVDLAVDVKTL